MRLDLLSNDDLVRAVLLTDQSFDLFDSACLLYQVSTRDDWRRFGDEAHQALARLNKRLLSEIMQRQITPEHYWAIVEDVGKP